MACFTYNPMLLTKYRSRHVNIGQRVYIFVLSCGVRDAAIGRTAISSLDTTHHHFLSIMQGSVAQTTFAVDAVPVSRYACNAYMLFIFNPPHY
jgi:hypothetical protein